MTEFGRTNQDDVDTLSATLVSAKFSVTPGGGGERVPPVSLEDTRLQSLGFDRRHEIGERLGLGGMGEVRVAVERSIGREVAVKYVKDEHRGNPTIARRFEREARIQGKLEHPCIIPVYEFGLRDDGAAYFTMKRVRGRTLRAVLDDMAARSKSEDVSRLRRRVLRAFVQLCQAISYAHARGVIHRDLKPSNVILGPFGEVYVLDWGVAKVMGADDEPVRLDITLDGEEPLHGPRGLTGAGSVLGTPGYMAPEQVIGGAESVRESADIYALGVMLFEVYTGERFHEGDSTDALLDSTLDEDGKMHAERLARANLPREIGRLCERATMLLPAERLAAVDEMIDELERYNAGERDTARRKELALAHIAAARGRIFGAPVNDDQLVLSRATALRELGAAVSLDPTNADALGLIVHAVTAPGVSLPDEARRALADKAARRMRTFAQSVWKSWAVWAALSLCFFWIGSPHPALLVALFSAMVLLILLGAHVARTGIQRPWEYWTLNAGTLVLTVLCSFFFGTYFFSVGLATATALYATSVYPSRTERARAVYWAVAAVGISLALGWSGWVPSNLQFLEGAIVVRPAMIHFPKPWTEVIMATTALFWLVAVTGPSRALVDSKFADEEKLAMQAWLFRNLLPEPADRSAPPDGVGAEPSSLRMP